MNLSAGKHDRLGLSALAESDGSNGSRMANGEWRTVDGVGEPDNRMAGHRQANRVGRLVWWRSSALVAVWSFCLVSSGGTTAGASDQSDYLIEDWQIEDGLPQSSVMSIAQTPDGYLWLATFGGLARFDGVQFTVFDTSNLPGLPDNRLVRLAVDGGGGLWMVTERNEVARLLDGRCQVFGETNGVPVGGARWVAAGPQGQIWLAGVKRGLWRWTGERFVAEPLPSAFSDRPFRMHATGAGELLWFSHPHGVLRREGQALVPLPETPTAGDPSGNAICSSRDAGLWMIGTAGASKYDAGQWRPDHWSFTDFKGGVMDVREDLAGNVWVATYRDGLFRFNPTDGCQRFTVGSGLTTLNLRSLFCDREGNAWVGTDGGGLLRVKPRLWRMITRRDGLGVDAIHSVTEDAEGRIWLAGGGPQPYWIRAGRVSGANLPPRVAGLDSAWSVLSGRDGALWIATYHGRVFRYANDSLECYGEERGYGAGSARAMMEDRSGAIWVGGFKGLSRIQAGQVTHFSRRDGLSSERVWALAEGVPGSLYVGTSGGGLNLFRDGRFTTYTRRHGLPDDDIRALYVDAQSSLWIGTQAGGLCRFREGSFFSFAKRGGLPARSVGPMTEDRSGRLWMVSSMGIVRVSRRELDDFAAGGRDAVSYVTYDRNDGLATIEVGGVQPACLRARDGTLWFGTTKGAACVSPDALPHDPAPVPVIIEEVRVDDQLVGLPGLGRMSGPDKGAEVRLAGANAEPGSPRVTLLPHQRRIEFRFTGLSLAAPSKVQFRYQMQNFDPDWIPGATARRVSYTRLPPGDYRFRVTARNDSGVWNDTGAVLGVVVLPPYHQTWWFRALVMLAAAVTVGAVFLLRVTRLKQLARLRARIAGDLHDEIGSNLGGIILLSELTQHTGGLPAEARGSLQEINATAQRSATVMRDIVWFLNPDFDTPGDMVARMREFARSVLPGVECQFEVAGLPSAQRLSLEFRRGVFFTFKEIVHNIAKHAGATRVRISLCRTGRRLVLRVEDNGCGFDSRAGSSGHGLRSLRQRVADLGGQLTIESSPGQGTAIVLTAPWP